MTEVISSSTATVTSPNRVIPYVSVATSVRKAAAGLRTRYNVAVVIIAVVVVVEVVEWKY